MHILEQISVLIIHLIQATGYFAVFILMTLESALIPIPSEITMPFAGFLASKGQLVFPLVVLTGALGNLVGSLIAYAIGYYLEETILLSLIQKYGKYILVTTQDYHLSMKWFKKYGSPIAFFSRMLPAIRTFISLPAGMSEMNLIKFSIYTFLGSLLWSFILTYLGFYLGHNWNSLQPVLRKFQLGIEVVIILLILWYINHKLKFIQFTSKH